VYPRTQTTDLLASLPPGRVLPAPSDIELNRRIDVIAARAKIIAPPNTLLPYRVRTVTGKDQIFPKWYQDFATLVEPQLNMSHVVFDQNRSPLFDLLNVRYVLVDGGAAAPGGFQPIQTAEAVSIYENPSALERSFFAPRVEVVRNQDEAMAKMGEAAFDPAKTVVLEDPDGSLVLPPPDPAAAGAGNQESRSTATIIEDRRNSIQVATDSEVAGILFLSDTYYPGWRADVDGASTRIYKADVAFRAIQVPPGRHVVHYLFTPSSFRVSLYVAAAGILVTIAGLVVGRRRVPEQ